MKKLLLPLVFILAACGSAPQASHTPTSTPTVNDCASIKIASTASVGDGALPSAKIECLEGKQLIDISHLRGPLVVPVWASWCEPCATEMPLMQQFYSQHHDKVQVLGIALMDTTEQAIAGSYNWGVTLPSLEDPDGAYRGFLNVQAPPTTLFIDESGIVVYRKVGAFASLAEIVTAAELYLKVTL